MNVNPTEYTHEVLAGLDDTVRPQDDFFRYVNGKWLTSTEIPADQSSTGTFYDLHNEAQRQVREIIAQLGERAGADGESVSEEERKIGALFNSFMDEARAEELGAAPLAPDFAVIAAARDKHELAQAVGTLYRTGVGAPFAVDIDVDRNDPSRYIPWISQSGLGLPDEAYYHAPEHADTLAAYRAFIPRLYGLILSKGVTTGAAPAAGADEGADRADTSAAPETSAAIAPATPAAPTAEQEAQAAAEVILRVETELASHHFTVVEERDVDKTNNLMSWADFLASAPGFDWEAAFAPLGLTPASAPELLIYTPRALTGFAAAWQELSLAELKTYLRWQAITARASFLSKDIAEQNFDFYGRTLSGQQEMRPRWKRAVGLVNGAMGEAVGKIYVSQHFPPAYKEQMRQLVDDLLQAYRESITSLDWMTAATKARALEKLDTFMPKIGYPDKWRDYSALRVREDDLVGNVRAVAEFETERDAAKLGSPVDRTEWFMTPQTVNAYYNPTMNEIVFPAAILQPPFFTAGADAAWNYGSIGAVIGHEIGHGFDDQGSKYDGTGKLENWWSDADRAAFEQRTAALVAQYEAYVPAQLGADSPHHVQGELTLGENIGDLGGLAIAIKAYGIALRRAGVADGLAGAPVIEGLTGIQRLLISYALSWQEKRRSEYMIQLLAIDPHSPAEFRCNGIVKNIPEFAQAFNVQPGDALYLAPEQRVHIW